MSGNKPSNAPLIFPSHAKINLFLEVLGRRPDGYHEIITLMHEISPADTVRLYDAPSGGIKVECNMQGIPSGRDNLAYRAAASIRRLCGIRRGVRIVLEKQIPAGAGLGGGSSNAAAVLKGLNKLWKLGLKRSDMLALAAGIGSDIPFFIVGGTALCTGRGEKVRPLRARRKLNFIIAIPPFSVSTPDVYRKLKGINLTLAETEIRLLFGRKEILKPGKVAGILFNQLEEPAFRLFPELKRLKTSVARACSGGALLCGSGSAVFGLCRSAREAASAADALRRAGNCEVLQATSRC